MSRRVVVTGIGMVNPMGHDPETVWSGLKESKSGVGRTTLFDATGFPTQISKMAMLLLRFGLPHDVAYDKTIISTKIAA